MATANRQTTERQREPGVFGIVLLWSAAQETRLPLPHYGITHGM